MERLVKELNHEGRTVYLDIVSFDERSALQAVNLATRVRCDVIMGSVYSRTIREIVRSHGMRYFPFVGQVMGHPPLLSGSVAAIAAHAQYLSQENVDGMEMLAYRYEGGNVADLMHEVVMSTEKQVVAAGSINSLERISALWEAGVEAFTVGSALFTGQFIAQGSYRTNLARLIEWLSDEQDHRRAADSVRCVPAEGAPPTSD
jgi:hypothetical protein